MSAPKDQENGAAEFNPLQERPITFAHMTAENTQAAAPTINTLGKTKSVSDTADTETVSSPNKNLPKLSFFSFISIYRCKLRVLSDLSRRSPPIRPLASAALPAST